MCLHPQHSPEPAAPGHLQGLGPGFAPLLREEACLGEMDVISRQNPFQGTILTDQDFI